MRNGDLVPNAAGMITKQQTFDALMHVGISKKVATETTDANFDHLDDPKQLNVFRMNTINTDGTPDPPGPLEHFRSTGIRDGGNHPQPDADRYAFFHQCAQFDGRGDEFGNEGAAAAAPREVGAERRCGVVAPAQSPTPPHATPTLAKPSPRVPFPRADIRDCATLVWDHEDVQPDFRPIPARLPSNDILESKRPSTCGPGDSGQERCESQLHGAIVFMHQEFGTPSGESAEMHVDDMRSLWLEAHYPQGFLARSPRSCADASDSTASGCQQCLDEVPSMSDHTSIEAQRFCRCLASKQLTTHQLDAIPAHSDLQCPRGPVVDARITVAHPHDDDADGYDDVFFRRSRALNEVDDEQALRGILADFYASLGLEYHEADVLIRPLSATTYSVRLAVSRENAIYLAHSVRSVLPEYVPGTPGPTPLQLTSVGVSDDIRLQSNCGQFCEASGSFLKGIPPPPPLPPAAPPGSDPCLNPCLQSTCLNVSAFGTCDQLASIGCSCNGCCTNPPSPPPLLPPPPPCTKVQLSTEGWQMISFNCVGGLSNTFEVLDTAPWETDDKIMTRDPFLKFATYDGEKFVGGLINHDQLLPSLGYKIFYSGEPANLTQTGFFQSVEDVVLRAGWNWIGHAPSDAVDILEIEAIPYIARGDFSMDDQIKTRAGSDVKITTYTGQNGTSAWQGNIDQLTPGIGYEVKVANELSFCYGNTCSDRP